LVREYGIYERYNNEVKGEYMKSRLEDITELVRERFCSLQSKRDLLDAVEETVIEIMEENEAMVFMATLLGEFIDIEKAKE